MTALKYQILRLLSGAASVLVLVYEPPLWWIVIIPWAILCIFGIIATIPSVVAVSAFGAQADAFSDAFDIGQFVVMPTLLSILIAELYKWRTRRKSSSSHNDTAEQVVPPNGP